MVVNESKSAFIIRLGGTHGAKWLKEHLRIIDGKKVIQLSHGLHNITVPVVKQVKHLGAMVSYFDFEMASVRHRLQAAGVARQRLARVIHSSRYLGLAQRLQMYEACVRTTLLYGVSVMKLPEKAVTALHRRDVKYVRAAAKSPVHITRKATHTLLGRLRIKSVVEILTRATTFPVDSSFASLQATENRESSTTLLPIPDTAVQHACPTCGLYFPSRHIMKIHHKRKHKISLPRTQKPEATDITQAELIQHSKDGMPHCKYCSKRFAGWAEFRWHVVNACESRPQDDAPMNNLETPEQHQYASAPGVASEGELAPAVSDLGSADAEARPAWQFAAGPAPASTEADNLPLAQRAELTTALQKPQWYLYVQLPGVLDRLRNHCVFCNQWLSHRSGALENHLKAHHPEHYRRQKDVRSLCRTTPTVKFSPCSACGSCFAAGTKTSVFGSAAFGLPQVGYELRYQGPAPYFPNDRGTVKLTPLEELQLVFQHVQTGPAPTEDTAAPMEVQRSEEQQGREMEESQAKYHRSAAKGHGQGKGPAQSHGQKSATEREAKETEEAGQTAAA